MPPFRELTDAEEDAVVADIHRSSADVVWVGLGVPKQKWMARMRPRLQTPVLVGVGAAFDAGLSPGVDAAPRPGVGVPAQPGAASAVAPLSARPRFVSAVTAQVTRERVCTAR